jgi:hypothetical protein
MIRSFLPLLVFLGAATTGPAQNSAPSEPDKKPAGTLAITGKGSKPVQQPPGEDSDGLVLAPGELSVVVGQVEAAVPKLVGANGETGTMPNIVYGPGTETLSVPTALRLRRVNPVQALALIAAASGCTLEAINAPLETGEAAGYSGAKIIGYQFVLADARNSLLRGMQQRANQDSAKPEGGVGAPDSRPTGALAPASQPPTNSSTFGTSSRPVGNDGGGGAYTAVSGWVARELGSGTLALGRAPVAAANAPMVRVYALGPIMGGLSDEELAEKQAELEKLMLVAMEYTGAASERPTLHFHRGTMTLLVKGTSTDHDVVDQIIRAMKENAESGTAKGGFGGGN